MMLQALILALLFAWLVYVAITSRRSSKGPASALPHPPVCSSWIPFVGHIYGIATRGSNIYISTICATQRASVQTLKLPGMDIHLIHPLDWPSIKQFTSMRHLSLMSVFHDTVGPAMGLVPASRKFLTDPDAGVFKRELSKLFNRELRSLQNLRDYASQLEQTIGRIWCEAFTGDVSEIETGLGSWLFDLLSRSMGSVFWGERGPFEDREFRNRLRLFIQNLETLRSPIPWLIPSELTSARKFVREKLTQCIQDKSYGAQGATLFAELAMLYESLEIPQEGFTDCHLVAIVGLMSNVINMIIWAFCEIVANSDLMSSLLVEISAIVDDPFSPSPTIDVDRIRRSCPLLVATWYELLRTYGDSPVARGVHEDSIFDNKYQLKKGSIIMTPIRLHNFDKDIWGEDAETFQPRRFLRNGGHVDQELVKHLTVFGLPGMHQCPGRYLGLTLTLAVVAKAMLTFNITPAPGDVLGRGIVPLRKDTMLGLPAIRRDPAVTVSRRKEIRMVHVNFDNVRPGW